MRYTQHIGTARKTYLIERFSDLLETVEEKQQAVSETATSGTSEQSYILTEENWDSIPKPWLGLQMQTSNIFLKNSASETQSAGICLLRLLNCCCVCNQLNSFFDCDIMFLNIPAESKLCTCAPIVVVW